MKLPEPAYRTCRVAAVVLNVRHAPGRNHRVLGRLPYGTLVEAAEQPTPGWGTPGWVPVLCRLRDGDLLIGYAAAAHLEAPVEDGLPPLPSWLAVANREIGLREYRTPDENPRFREYFRDAASRAEDARPWSAAFIEWCLGQSGLRGSGSAASRAWLAWGEAVEPPRLGCIAVLKHADAAGAKVGFYLQRRGAVIDLLGTVEGNRVCVSPFPAAQVLGYRWPEAQAPGEAVS